MRYKERRRRVFELMAEAGELIAGAGEDRSRLWAIAGDDLADAVTANALSKPLREAFTDASRDFWLRENSMHSIRVGAEKPHLHLVSRDAS